MIYDGECVFCCRWIERWKVMTGDEIDYAPFQEVAERFPEIRLEEFTKGVQLVDLDGGVYAGVEAVFKGLENLPFRGLGIRLYRDWPLFARISNVGYSLVARNRYFFSAFTRLLWGRDVTPPTYQFSSWLFIRLVGVTALFAFISYWTQADGLIGENGILPFTNLLQNVDRHWERNEVEVSKYWQYPTLIWLNQSQDALNFLFTAGIIASILLIIGVAAPLAAISIWAIYLSLMSVGGPFLSFQWDILLLETVFLTIFFVPFVWWDRLSTRPLPSHLARWLIWLLLFKLMFESGLVKLTYYGANSENTWRDLTALNYHYWSQPIPSWSSWYFHHLPNWMHKISLWFMFAVELGCPFFIWLPRRFRIVGFFGLVLFQILIAASGNYGFFNLLTIVLCVPLIDDQSLPDSLRKLTTALRKPGNSPFLIRLPRLVLLCPLTLVIVWMGAYYLRNDFRGNRPNRERVQQDPPEWVRQTRQKIRRLHIVNPYGLFRVMTKTRPEIIIEGSEDGLNWKPYIFKWKPVDPTAAPEFMSPHMPRLDWQMWFAGLRIERNRSFRTSLPWFSRLIEELSNNNPTVLSLLEENPFPESPPRLIRLLLYHYTFSDPETKRTTGAWWDRKLLDHYTLRLRVN